MKKLKKVLFPSAQRLTVRTEPAIPQVLDQTMQVDPILEGRLSPRRQPPLSFLRRQEAISYDGQARLPMLEKKNLL
jgi:hypothetical protein